MDIRPQWHEDGFLVLRGVLDVERVEKLRRLAERALAQFVGESTVDGEPGGFAWGPQAWVLTHLNHRKYHRFDDGSLPTLLDTVADAFALDIVRQVLGDEPAFLQSNLYFDPPGEDRIGTWHRDCQFFTAGDEARERAAFEAEADPPRELHMHIPLVSTSATGVVPGSHLRWDTEEQLDIRRNAPEGAMPGGLRLQMNPGDLGFFHVNSIHRGYYEHGVTRRTIAVTFGRSDSPRPITAANMTARIFPCNYQPWCADPDYLDGTAPTTRAFFDRFEYLYGSAWADKGLAELMRPELQQYYAAR